MATQKGVASTSATNLLASPRWFHFGVDGYTINADGSLNALPSSWEIDAGASVTLRFRQQSSGLTPTVAPNKVTLIAYYETGTGTVVRTFAPGTGTVADNTTYTFHGTANGQAGGGDRCGTLRLYVRAVKDDSTGGLSDYDVNSDSSDLAGALRVNMLATDLSVNAYPAGSTFAYGTAGNETITLTGTHTQRYADRNVETVRIDALDVAATQASGSAKEIGTTTTAQNFTADNTFDDAAKSYGMKFTVTGNSLLMPTEKWALPKASGANVTQSGTEAVERQSFYNVDPRITITNVTLSKPLHNLGFATTIDFNAQNARLENLTRSINYQLKNSSQTVRKSGSDTGPNYDIDYTLLDSDDASFDFTGKQWTFNTNQADVDSNPSANAYRVSSKMMLGSAVGLNDLAVTTDKEKYMRGYSPNISYYLSEADGTALASKSVNTRVHDDSVTSNEEDVQVVTTTAGGLVSYPYTIGNNDKATDDEFGSGKHIEADWSGNSTDDSAEEWSVSGLLLVPGYVDADNAGDFWTGKTDLDATNDFDPDGTDETDFFVGADVAYGKVRIVDVNGDPYDGAEVTMWLLRNSVISQGPQVGSLTDGTKNGWQDLFYQFDVKAPAGARVFRIEAAKDGNTTGNATRGPGYLTKNVNYAPSYTGNLSGHLGADIFDADGDGSIRIHFHPFILATNNDEQVISAVSPTATIDIIPQVTIRQVADNMPVQLAQTDMVQTTGDDDDWHYDVSLPNGFYVATIYTTINGGQFVRSIPLAIGQSYPHQHIDEFVWDLAIGER